ncbi:hypothetical protein C9374_009196 [Naegleria lovaniensis]|uniref:SHSP domain-containing protein n=1 Tax=Naegleria lovaniensis TaxID=51637 RepID=A0AA88KFC6_NAELO|nr:uncharacterized protein C9374_009196 [Naegleria lovaniensis]KAG2377680.1 hypothetical protein C9374_009196 [Naegleria lovaniensis]
MLSRYNRGFNDFFDDPFFSTSLMRPWTGVGGDIMGTQMSTFNPATDVSETDRAICLRSNLPGLRKEDIRIDVDDQNRTLTFSGETHSEKTDENEVYHRTERSYGKFSRTFRLPQNVDLDNIKANMDHGVLKINIPKLEQQQKQTRSIGVE